MYGSPSARPSEDLNLPYPPAGPFSGQRTAEAESDLLRRQHQQQQMSSGLLRYRSAPSSLLGEVCEDFLPGRASSPETETMFVRFLAPDLRDETQDGPSGGAATASGQSSPHFPPPPPPPPPSAKEVKEQQSRGFTSSPQMIFHPQQQRQMQSHSSADSSFRAVMGSLTMEAAQLKHGDFGSSSNLIRHSSSPAGLFSHLNVDEGTDSSTLPETVRLHLGVVIGNSFEVRKILERSSNLTVHRTYTRQVLKKKKKKKNHEIFIRL
ncbi:hypothetical protein BHM03_00034360 [Ensete ventricosum]|nr:hypothetical protein BHM03_00034360 [Ensete ventricosum]